MHPCRSLIASALALLASLVFAQAAPEAVPEAAPIAGAKTGYVFPADAGLVDVTKPPYNLKGDGVTDNTAGLRLAFANNRGKNNTLYFPNGIYLVGDRVNISGNAKSKAHSSSRFLHLQGQSREGAILRLKDNAPGFNNPAKPKTFISLYEGQSTGDVMHAYVRSLTVEIGNGNPGAAALRYMTNNSGAVYDVTIRSLDPEKRGAIGLDLRQSQNGPGLIKNVSIDGFDYGIQTANTFSLVFEHITVTNQRKAGFNAGNSRLTIRNLQSNSKVPAFTGVKHTQLTLIEGDLQGNGTAATAITVVNPKVLIRDVKVAGYAHSIKTANGTFVDGPIAEWHDGKAHALFGAKPATLRLPIKETLEIPWEMDMAKWVKVAPGEDGLQAAIDQAAAAGKTTIYFPKIGKKQGKYVLTQPVRVHGSVNRIIGMENILWISPKLPIGGVAITFAEDLKGPIVFERFFNVLKYGGWKGLRDRYLFESKSKYPIIVRNIAHGACRLKKPNPNQTWFLEDIATHLRMAKGEKVWARQLNPESPKANMIEVDGGQLWVLGLKTEGRATHVLATNGAKVEILGGVSYQSWKKQPLDPPMFIVKDNAQASFTLGFYHHRTPFSTIVEETIGDQTRRLPRKSLVSYHLPVYRTGQSNKKEQP